MGFMGTEVHIFSLFFQYLNYLHCEKDIQVDRCIFRTHIYIHRYIYVHA